MINTKNAAKPGAFPYSQFKIYHLSLPSQRHFLEAPPGIEPGDKGFADLCLTAWLWRHINILFILFIFITKIKSRHNQGDFGADYEARTRYLHLGKVALYQMS